MSHRPSPLPPYKPAWFFVRDNFGRHACNRSTGRYIFHDHSPGANSSPLADMHAFDDAHRGTNIYFILYDRAMEVQTPNCGEVTKINIVTYHSRCIDHHRATVQQQKAISNLCGSGNVDMTLLGHPPSDKPRYPPTRCCCSWPACARTYISVPSPGVHTATSVAESLSPGPSRDSSHFGYIQHNQTISFYTKYASCQFYLATNPSR